MGRGRVLLAASAYFAVAFVCGFAFGTLRVLVVAPRIGALAGVLAELPFMLAIGVVAARRLCRRFKIATPLQRAAMGALAFVLLQAAEAGVALWGLGQPAGPYAAALMSDAGLAGLAGQIAFAALPLLGRAG